MTSLPPPSGDMEKIIKELERQCSFFGPVYEPNSFSLNTKDLIVYCRALEADIRERKERNREGIEKMFAKMCELDTPKRGELHRILIQLFS